MDSATIWLLAAVFAQVALTVALAIHLGIVRASLVTSGAVELQTVALSPDNWPERAHKASRAFDNQFQLPVLFYVGAIIATNIGPIWIETAFAWLFVASRVIHALIHVTTNVVAHRAAAYITGFVLLVAFWLVLGGRFFVAALVFGHP